jgi:Ran GTPase-activating protein (RanGAP) involved in mRNA processing and transport
VKTNGRWEEGDAVTIDTTMTEADCSGKKLGVVGAQILAAFMAGSFFQDKRAALSNLHIGCNDIPEEQMRVFISMDKLDVLCAVPIKELKANSVIMELDLAGKSLGTEGALVLSTCLKADTSGALSSLDLSGNSIGQEKETKAVMASLGAALKTSKVEVLDISSNYFKGDELEGFCQHIPDMGSLSELDLSENDLRSEGLSVVSEALKLTTKSTSIKQLDIAENNLTYNTQDEEDMSGVIKFTEDMKDMGPLASLDISNNGIGSEQEAKIKQICAGKSIKCTLADLRDY